MDISAIFRQNAHTKADGKFGIGRLGDAAMPAVSPDAKAGRKSRHGHNTTSKADRFRRGRVRPFGILARGSQAHRDLSHHRKSHRARQPRRDPGAGLYPLEEDGLGRSRPDRRSPGRYALAGGGRWQVRLRADGHAAGGQDRHRQMQGVGARRGGAAQCRAYRPRRRLGRNGRRRRAGVDPFRQCRRLAAGRALWRRPEAAVDRALLRRHSASGAGSDRAGFRHLDRGRRQGAGGKPRRQEAAEGRAGRSRWRP